MRGRRRSGFIPNSLAAPPCPEDIPVSLIIYSVAGLYLYRLVAGTELRVVRPALIR